MKIIFNIIFFLLYVNTYIILPFNQLNPDLEYLINNNNITDKLAQCSLLNLYTTIYMGNNPFKLLVKLSQYNTFFSFASIPYINYTLTNYSFYNPFKSKSLHRNKAINFQEEFREATDVFYFITNENELNNIYQEKNNNEINENNYKPYLYLNCLVSNWYFSDNYTGMLGLGKNSNYYQEYNFINELKIKAVINRSIWSLDFYDENNYKNNLYDKGNLIIGEYPHIYNSKKYKKENYYRIKLYNENYNDWIIKIDNSFIIKPGEVKTSSNDIKYINIIFNLHIMEAPYFLFEQLNLLFFEKYFEKKICQYQKINKDNDEKIFISCSKKKFEDEKKFFPKIFFTIKNNKNNIIKFEFNYTDIFQTKKDKIYFLISFNKKGRQDMIKVGLIFLYKYKIVFDYDNSEIGLYINNNLKNEKNNEIIYIIIFLIIFLGFIFFGYKKEWWCNDIMKSKKIKKR